MIYLLPLNKLLVFIAVFYAIMTLLIMSVFSYGYPVTLSITTIFKWSMSWAAVLNILILVIVHWHWEHIWKEYPKLNKWLFPNLNGKWDMQITWIAPLQNKKGVVSAHAIIKQNLLTTSMEVISDNSESETLILQPKKDPESGRPIIYYVYRVVPKLIELDSGPSYLGSATLKFTDSNSGTLSGNYFTSKQTSGHFTLTRKL